jgi:hypothetical protein
MIEELAKANTNIHLMNGELEHKQMVCDDQLFQIDSLLEDKRKLITLANEEMI